MLELQKISIKKTIPTGIASLVKWSGRGDLNPHEVALNGF